MQQDLLKTVEFDEPEPPLPSVRLSCLICSPGDEGWGRGGGLALGWDPCLLLLPQRAGHLQVCPEPELPCVVVQAPLTPAAWGEAGGVVREDAGCVTQGGDSLSQLLAVPRGREVCKQQRETQGDSQC